MTREFAARHPAYEAISIAYSVWDQVGMGARMGSVEKLSKMGIDAIDVDQGVRRCINLFLADPGTDQVVVTARLDSLDSWRPVSIPKPENQRFLKDVVYLQPGVELRAKIHLTLDEDHYLSDHVYNGSHLFPTVFGLEAMAQVAAHVTGRAKPTFIRLEDVSLERPVVVDPDRGATIGLFAEASEENEQGETFIRVRIRTERTGMALYHFAATLVLGNERQGPIEDWELGEMLDIDPGRDLYGDLLFQGPKFQKMEGVYGVDDVHCTMHSQASQLDQAAANCFAPELGTQLLLGDPFFRDLLLQSVQLLIPQHDCLPISIGLIERF